MIDTIFSKDELDLIIKVIIKSNQQIIIGDLARISKFTKKPANAILVGGFIAVGQIFAYSNH